MIFEWNPLSIPLPGWTCVLQKQSAGRRDEYVCVCVTERKIERRETNLEEEITSRSDTQF